VNLSNNYATGQFLPLLALRCPISVVLPAPFYFFQEFRLLFLIGRSEDYLTLFRQKNVPENKVEEFSRFGAGWFQKRKAEKK